MRVLFHHRGPEWIAVECLIAFLKAAGHETALAFDPGAEDSLYFRAPMARRLNRYGRLFAEAEAFRPDLIAFSMCTNLYPFYREAAAEYRRRMPDVPIIAGGDHPTAAPEHVIADPRFDMLCVGEGEHALLDVVNALERGESVAAIPNVWSKDAAGNVYRNEVRPIEEDLDKLPYLDKEAFRAVGAFREVFRIPTGRGCPYRCTFCQAPTHQRDYDGKGRTARKRGVGSLLAELRHWRGRWRFDRFQFVDPTFNIDIRWVREFLPAYRRHLDSFPFMCQLVAQNNAPEVIAELGRSGCRMVFMGLDSGNERVRRDVMKREFSNERFLAVGREVKKAGIQLFVSSMFGAPGETPEEMEDTLRLVDELRPDILNSYIMYPFPKTEVFEKAVESGLIDEDNRRAILDGEGSYKHGSMFKRHPYRRQAESFAFVASAYNVMPTWMRPLARRIARTGRLRWALRALFLATIPVLIRLTGRAEAKDFLRGVLRANLPARASA